MQAPDLQELDILLNAPDFDEFKLADYLRLERLFRDYSGNMPSRDDPRMFKPSARRYGADAMIFASNSETKIHSSSASSYLPSRYCCPNRS
jgi:hypothetical protein